MLFDQLSADTQYMPLYSPWKWNTRVLLSQNWSHCSEQLICLQSPFQAKEPEVMQGLPEAAFIWSHTSRWQHCCSH